MRGLMESNPEEFARRAMPEPERAQLPAPLRPFIERRLKGRGFFGVYCVFPKPGPQPSEIRQGHRSGYAYEVRLHGVTYKAFVFGKWEDQTTVLEVTIDGVTLQDAIVLGESPTPAEQGAAGGPVIELAPSTSGPNTLLYMIASFSDEVTEPISEATALTQMGVVNDFWLNNSSGTVSLRGLVNPTQVMDVVHIVLPHPMSYGSNYNNSFGLLLSDARAAAFAQGYNYADYNLDAVITSDQSFNYAGRAYIGAQGAHLVKPYTTLRTAGHELGHNLGLYHANYWRTDATKPFGRDSVPGGYVGDTVNAEWIEYGHYSSLMGAQYGSEWDDATKPHYAAAEKVRLGWLSANAVQFVTNSGTYRLYRHDERSAQGTPRGLRVETSATDYTGYVRRYWLNYRYAPWSTALNWLRNGLQVDICRTTYGNDGVTQLDMTPYSKDDSSGASWTDDNTDKVDGALIVGCTYSDPYAGIHITPVATGSDTPNEEYINVVIKLGTFPGNNAPVIARFSVSTNQATLGQAVSFSVVASDPDGDALAYSWDFDQVQTWTQNGLNSPTATKSWSNAGQYRVTVTVSDMKGGVATESVIVTVGTPAHTSQIWGRVVWGGQGLYGVRVWTTAGSTTWQAWTESDGAYALTDLPATNSYTVKCMADGLTFTAQFANPVAVVPGDAYGKDFYANEPLPPGFGTPTFALSGQVTDAGSGVVGAEVRAGGLVTTTDTSGNYQFTNFPGGTYTLVPRKDDWTFSPASQGVTLTSANAGGNNFARVALFSISGRIDGLPVTSQSPGPTVYLSNGRSVRASLLGRNPNRYWGYTLSSVPAGQFSVSAELAGYRIVPSGFSNPLLITGNLLNVNFNGSAAPVDWAINGRVTELNRPLAGVTVEARQGTTPVGSALTDSDGCFRIINVTNGAYTLVPSRAGYTFSPPSRVVGGFWTGGNNFAAIGSNSPPMIGSVTATPAIVPSAAATATLSAVASGGAPLGYSWGAVTARGPVTFSVNDSTGAASTVVSFLSPGVYAFCVWVTDSQGFVTTSNVNLTVSAGPRAVVVSPCEVQVAEGGTVAFRADAWDDLGNRISVSPAWSVRGGGSIASNGLFSATTAGGPYQVEAVAGTLSATGSVWVVPSPPLAIQSIALSNHSITITWNAISGRLYRVECKDSLNNSHWNVLTPHVLAVGPSASKTDTVVSGQRFYRVLLLPWPSLAIQSIVLSNASVTITWNAISGRTYRVECKDSLHDGNWNVLTPDVPAVGQTASKTDAVVSSQRFYRVLLLP